MDAHKAFLEWDALLTELRQSILAKQNQSATAPVLADPAATAACHPEPDPSLSSVPFSHPKLWGLTPLNDPIWEILPSLDACFRRVYKCITFGPGGMADWAFLRSSSGRKYLTNLFLQVDEGGRGLGNQSMGSGTDAHTIRETYFPTCLNVSNPPPPTVAWLTYLENPRATKFNRCYPAYERPQQSSCNPARLELHPRAIAVPQGARGGGFHVGSERLHG